jgi:PASTA domain
LSAFLADGEGMAARIAMLAPRFIALVVIWLLAWASFSLAQDSGQAPPPAAPEAVEPEKPEVLVVPDVRRQAYVFAKGILQDAGFAWRVRGDVDGFAANTVGVQSPAPGTRVIDNGAPVVTLNLKRSTQYAERGLPENTAPFSGSKVVLVKEWRKEQKQSQPPATAPEAPPAETAPATTTPAPTPPATTTPAPPTTTAPAATAPAAPPAQDAGTYRKPDFAVADAPREPADEMPLPARARALEARAAMVKKPNPRFVDFWLYQHTWIVTGARFGWKDGDVALKTLIRVDGSLQARFGFGRRSQTVARRALAYVESRKG